MMHFNERDKLKLKFSATAPPARIPCVFPVFPQIIECHAVI